MFTRAWKGWRLSAACVLGLVAVSVAQNLGGAQPVSGVSISITPTKSAFKVGEKILVRVVTTNQSSKKLSLIYSEKRSSFVIEIHDKSGNIPRETAHGCLMHVSAACGAGEEQQSVEDQVKASLGRAQTAVWLPGERSDNLLDVSDEYELDQPGVYTVDVTESDFNLVNASVGGGPAGASSDIEKVGPVRSNTVAIQIVQ